MNNPPEEDYAFLGNANNKWQKLPKDFIKQLDNQQEEE